MRKREIRCQDDIFGAGAEGGRGPADLPRLVRCDNSRCLTPRAERPRRGAHHDVGAMTQRSGIDAHESDEPSDLRGYGDERQQL